MRNHTKIYYNHFGLVEQDIPLDEFEYVVNDRQVRAVSVHHISKRGMGGSKEKDFIENLMALNMKS